MSIDCVHLQNLPTWHEWWQKDTYKRENGFSFIQIKENHSELVVKQQEKHHGNNRRFESINYCCVPALKLHNPKQSETLTNPYCSWSKMFGVSKYLTKNKIDYPIHAKSLVSCRTTSSIKVRALFMKIINKATTYLVQAAISSLQLSYPEDHILSMAPLKVQCNTFVIKQVALS